MIHRYKKEIKRKRDRETSKKKIFLLKNKQINILKRIKNFAK